MDQNELENLLRLMKLVGGKFIIVEEGKPKSVLMSYDEFQEMATPYYAQKLSERLADSEMVNEEITKSQLSEIDFSGRPVEDIFEEVMGEQFGSDEITVQPLDG